MNVFALRRIGLSVFLTLLAGTARGVPFEGHVFDANSSPVSGAAIACFPVRSAELSLLDLDKEPEPKALAETRTDASGAFTLRFAKEPQEVRIRVIPSGALPSYETEERHEAGDPTEPTEIFLPDTARIAGRVVDESGQGVSGARIRIDAGDAYAETRTSVDGKFELPQAPADASGIFVRAPGYVRSWSSIGRRRQTETIVLKRGGTLEGKVVDAGGKAAAGAIVLCGTAVVEADEEGRYRFTAIAAGTVGVRAHAAADEGLTARRGGVRIGRGETTRIDLRLEPGAEISGVVIDALSRRPIAGARVTAQRGEFSDASGPALPDSFAETRTDTKGRFRIGGLAVRNYEVFAQRRGYLGANKRAGADRRGQTAVTIALRKSATVIGRVVDEKKAPVAGARVSAAWEGNIRAAMSSGSFFSATEGVFSRKDGSFRLEGLASGSVALAANREGYAPALRRGVAVRAGEVTRGVSLVLTGGSGARGRVVDRDGKPIAGAEIRVVPEAEQRGGSYVYHTSSDFPEKPSAVTDGQGAFTVKGLAAGACAAEVSAPGFSRRRYDALAVPQKEPAQWAPFVLNRGAPITGFVRNSRGEPVAGAEVYTYGGTLGYEDTQHSDAEGKFRCDEWPEGASVETVVRAPGYAERRQNVTAPAEDVVVVLTTAATVRGRVEDAESQTPLEVFSVRHHPPLGGGAYFRGRGGKSFESPDGLFEITDIAPGRIVLAASSPGYIEAEVGGLDLKEGEVREGVVIGLKKGRTISGHVVDGESGRGVADATVSWDLETADGRRGGARLGAAGEVPHSALTETDGRFRFDGVPPDRLHFLVQHADYVETEKTVDVSAETEIELTLSTGGSLGGTVADTSGRPIAEATVSLSQPGGARQRWSGDEMRAGPDGRFAFEHLAEGRYRLTASSAAGQSEPLEAVLTRGQMLDALTLTIRNGVRIHGRVTGLPATRLGGLRVSAYADTFSFETFTDDAGGFQIPGAPPGELDVSASTSATMQGRTVDKAVDVPAGVEEFEVELEFTGDSRLSGRVTRDDRGVPGIFIWIMPNPSASGSIQNEALTDAEGRYSAEGLPDGDYEVLFRGDGARVQKTVAVSGETTLDVALGGTTLKGIVTDEETHDPISDAIISVETGEETRTYGIRGGRSDSLGAYEIRDLEAGAYQVTVARSGYTSKTQPLALESETATLDVVLHRGSGLPLHATDGLTGTPLRGVDVLAFAPSGSVAFQGIVSLDTNGRGEIPSLPGGTYAVWIFASGYAPRGFTVPVPSSPLEVGLTPGGSVEVRSEASTSGRLYDGSGVLYLTSPGRLDGLLDVYAPLTVWDNLAPGSYRFMAGEGAWTFTIAEGKKTTLEIR